MPTKKTYTFPKAIGACADLLYTTQNERFKLQAAVKALDEKETALEEHIIKTLPKSQASGVAGRIARVKVNTSVVPNVKDWAKVWKYVKANDAFDLLQRRLSGDAVQARWDAKKSIPGVEKFNRTSVSVGKA